MRFLFAIFAALATLLALLQSTAAQDQCYCPLNYAPVLGSDGKTYSNACAARCAGVEVSDPPSDYFKY